MSNDPEMLEPLEEVQNPEENAEPADLPDEAALESASLTNYNEISTAYDPVLEPGKAEQEKPRSASPALTINIASWATPIVGLIMLVFGLAGGFFLRPVLLPPPAATAAPTAETAANPTAPAAQQEAAQPQQPSANDREALMSAIVPQVRHFKGNPEAPITLVEFSDFQ